MGATGSKVSWKYESLASEGLFFRSESEVGMTEMTQLPGDAVVTFFAIRIKEGK